MMEWLEAIGRDAPVWLTLEAVRATVVLLAGACAAYALRRASAAARHLVWCVALLSLLVLPLASRAVPWRWSPLPAASPAAVPESSVVVEPPASREVTAAPAERAVQATSAAEGAVAAASLPARLRAAVGEHALAIVLALWAAGALLSLTRLAVGGLVLRRTVRHARTLDDIAWRRALYEASDRLDVGAAPRLVVSERTPMPFVTGLLRPTIVLPAASSGWSEERRRAVLLHEVAHVRRRDLALNVVAHFARSLWWFHPLARIAAQRLRAESERACDDLVLRVGTLPSAYAQDLLGIVRDAGRVATPAVALPMAQRHEFEGRMLAILEAGARREPARRRHAVLAVVAFAALVVPLAGAGPAPANADTAQDPSHERFGAGDVADADIPGESRAHLPAADDATEHDIEDEARGGDDGDAGVWGAPDAERAAQDTGVVEALRAALRDPSGVVRAEAAWALGSMHATSAAADLAALLGDDSAEVRRMAIWALTQVEHEPAAGAIARLVRSEPDDETREMAVWALAHLAGPEALDGLIAALGDGSAGVRSSAAWAIGTLGPEDAPSALISALGDEDADVRESAAWALGVMGDADAVQPLARLIDDPDAGESALWAIGRIGGEAARPALMEALRNGSDEARAAAARALAGRGTHPWPRPRPRPIIRD